MRIGEITKAIEDYAPLWLQESYETFCRREGIPEEAE